MENVSLGRLGAGVCTSFLRLAGSAAGFVSTVNQRESTALACLLVSQMTSEESGKSGVNQRETRDTETGQVV
jgi:hypothetical protein